MVGAILQTAGGRSDSMVTRTRAEDVMSVCCVDIRTAG
jgi:hypothetical protein